MLRRDGLMVSARAGLWIERSGFEPWPGNCVVFLGKTLYSHSAQVYKWVRWTSIPSRVACVQTSPISSARRLIQGGGGSRNTPSRFMLRKSG